MNPKAFVEFPEFGSRFEFSFFLQHPSKQSKANTRCYIKSHLQLNLLRPLSEFAHHLKSWECPHCPANDIKLSAEKYFPASW